MIRRNDGNDWLIISQVDHAHLAAEIATVWGNDVVPALPLPELLVPAIQDHDDGWREWEKTPQIDPETGWPRDFTEMPMAVSTGIWTKSIELCSRGGSSMSVAREAFRRFLDARNLRMTDQCRIVLDIVLAQQIPFQVEDIFQILREMGEDQFVSRSTVYRTVILFIFLLDAGVIRHLEHHAIKDAYEVSDPIPQPSSLEGIWVSRHFCWLAEKALANRKEKELDQEAIVLFLQEQSDLQEEWRKRLAEQFNAERIDSLSDIGFRYLQFFDRISLWLCCAPRTEPFDTLTPAEEQLRFVWCVSGKMLVEPYPLQVDSLKLSVSTRRVSATTYASDFEFHDALANAPEETLDWVICR